MYVYKNDKVMFRYEFIWVHVFNQEKDKKKGGDIKFVFLPKYPKLYEQNIFLTFRVSMSFPTYQQKNSENWGAVFFYLGETCRKPGVSMWFPTDVLVGNR